MYSVLIFIQVQHKFIKLYLHSTIILIQTVTFIFYSSFIQVFYPLKIFLFIQHLVTVPNFGGGGRVGELRMCHPPYHPPLFSRHN